MNQENVSLYSFDCCSDMSHFYFLLSQSANNGFNKSHWLINYFRASFYSKASFSISLGLVAALIASL
ncbi:MAG: hypothetical protein K6U11_14660, partial [bacterium]|nr:hypothetical protein [bacterium]